MQKAFREVRSPGGVARAVGDELEEERRPARITLEPLEEQLGGLFALALRRSGLPERALDALELSHQAVLQKREEELLLAGEVVVDGPLRQACFLGDLVERRPLVAMAGEDLSGRLQQAGARPGAALGLPGAPAWRLVRAGRPVGAGRALGARGPPGSPRVLCVRGHTAPAHPDYPTGQSV